MFDFAQASFLHQFFEGVARTLARQMSTDADEEFLTNLLCRSLSQNAGLGLLNLPYSVANLNRDLSQGGQRAGPVVSFSTFRHNRRYENKISAADLGIVLTVTENDQLVDEKAILLQAKRLYAENSGKYRLDSQYRAFNAQQHRQLIDHKLDTCTYYLLYNPDLQEIDKQDQQDLIRLEHQIEQLGTSHCHLNWSQSFEQSLPGIRVTACSLLAPDTTGHTLRKGYLTCSMLKPDSCLATFADFMTYGLIACKTGARDQAAINLASGKKPAGRFSPVPFSLTLNVSVDGTKGPAQTEDWYNR